VNIWVYFKGVYLLGIYFKMVDSEREPLRVEEQSGYEHQGQQFISE